MINKITDTIISWLQRYLQRPDANYKAQALSLQKKLSTVLTFEALHELLTTFPIPSPPPAFFCAEAPDLFIQKVNSYVCYTNEIAHINLTEICSNLDSLTTDEQTRHFVALLNDILKNHQFLIHINALSLLRQLTNQHDLQRILNHLAIQPQRDSPTRPRRGSFDALRPMNEMHAVTLGLLRNNAGTFNEEDIDSSNANALLQIALSVYQDLSQPDELTTTVAAEPDPSPKGSCAIC